MKKKYFVLSCLALTGLLSFSACSSKGSLEEITYHSGSTANSQNTKDSASLNSTKKPSTTADTTIHKSNVEIDTTPDSYTVLVNKEYGLPEGYVPDDLVVPNIKYSFSYYDEKKLLRQVPATALEELIAAAADDRLTIKGVSGYRSYSRQKAIYNNNIKTKGLTHTEQYSAKPGYSEHQTGLSIDVSADSNGNGLTPAFGKTAEGKWLAENCYKFGFIIRYPEGKEAITGYSYEPWHIRYVGKELATYLTEQNLTLEEYYNYTPSATIAPDKSTDDYDLEEVPAKTPSVSTPKPTYAPTKRPSSTYAPTATPTVTSTPKATKKPVETEQATSTPKATKAPTTAPTVTKTPATTAPAATKKPAATPTTAPTVKPTVKPTIKPTPKPTKAPTDSSESDKNEASEDSSLEE